MDEARLSQIELARACYVRDETEGNEWEPPDPSARIMAIDELLAEVRRLRALLAETYQEWDQCDGEVGPGIMARVRAASIEIIQDPDHPGHDHVGDTRMDEQRLAEIEALSGRVLVGDLRDSDEEIMPRAVAVRDLIAEIRRLREDRDRWKAAAEYHYRDVQRFVGMD